MTNPVREHSPVSVVIPTYRREEVLIATVGMLLLQEPPVAEILVIDQSESHEAGTDATLGRWDHDGRIRWIRLTTPSQPGALNRGILEATQPLMLFLDDDIRIDADFVRTHAAAFTDPAVWAVVGQVLQPGEMPLDSFVHERAHGPLSDLEFPFRSASRTRIANGMSGNMSVRRDRAIELGGFDENFEPPVSYRFDSDFCKRLIAAGGRIAFEPAARIHHLRATRGGTRSTGSHLTSASPVHGAGDYYFALRRGVTADTIGYMVRRPFREVRTRFHLGHPWWIPVKFVGEVRALLRAVRLWRKGPRLGFPVGGGGVSG